MQSLLARPSPCLASPCRHYSTEARWDIVSAVCLERKPVITKPLTLFEQKYKSTLSEIELAGSYKSNHEIRLEEDKKRAALLKQSDNLDADMEAALKQSGQDFEDAGTEELAKFQLASRTGDGDVRSTDRKLDQHLVLVTKLKLGENEVWALPQGLLQEGETLRQTADRVLVDTLGSKVEARILGNAPFGLYKYKYPKAVRNETEGAKLFIFKALYYSGVVDLNSKVAMDFQWASRLEMRQLIVRGEYLRSIEAFLIDEDEEEEGAAVVGKN